MKMNLLAAMPQRPIVETLVEQLAAIEGVEAIVLGGSVAQGTQTPQSDVDLGIYYFPDVPFRIADVRRVVEAGAVEAGAVEPPTVTEFYGWGAWVNGGAWIHTPLGKVDLLYRNYDQVLGAILDAQKGITHQDYAQQPTYGFYSVGYLAETHICVPLYDPAGLIAEIKARVAAYPPQLRQKTVADGLWSAEFTLLHADSHAARGDVYNTAGCLGRTAANLTQVLFALNAVYFLSDKRVMATIDAFAVQPEGYTQRLAAILAAPGAAPQALEHSVAAIRRLWQETCELAGDLYPNKPWVL